jgi:hypothetical protein
MMMPMSTKSPYLKYLVTPQMQRKTTMRERDARRRELGSKDYQVGYGRPPAASRFQKGVSGNPVGKGRRTRAPNLKAQLQSALNKEVTIRIGKRQKTISRGAAGIEQLVDQFAKGDRNARRDLIAICEKLEIDLTNRDALQGALDDALSAEDQALLADFVRRHGGQYPVRVDAVPSLPAKDQNLLGPPADDQKLLTARSENSTNPQMTQPKEKSHD